MKITSYFSTDICTVYPSNPSRAGCGIVAHASSGGAEVCSNHWSMYTSAMMGARLGAELAGPADRAPAAGQSSPLRAGS